LASAVQSDWNLFMTKAAASPAATPATIPLGKSLEPATRVSIQVARDPQGLVVARSDNGQPDQTIRA